MSMQLHFFVYMNVHGRFCLPESTAAVFRHDDARVVDLALSGLASELRDQFVGLGQAGSPDGMTAGYEPPVAANKKKVKY